MARFLTEASRGAPAHLAALVTIVAVVASQPSDAADVVASRPIDAASSTPDPADVERALRRTPGPEFRGHDFASMSSALNGHLRRLSPNFRPCESFAYEELVGVGAAVVRSRSPALAGYIA